MFFREAWDQIEVRGGRRIGKRAGERKLNGGLRKGVGMTGRAPGMGAE